MTPRQQELIEDFKEWSGGFPPDECEERDVDTYIRLNMDDNDPNRLWMYEQGGVTVLLGMPIL